MKFVVRVWSFLLIISLAGGSFVGCERWELPERKTKRNCVKPEGTLNHQAQQRKVDFAITNSSGTIDGISWDFGNGSTTVTTGLTASITYATAGTYNVKAILSNTCTQETTLLLTVTVSDAVRPTVSVLSAADLTINSARLGMTIISYGNATVTRHGICYSKTNTTPSLANDKTKEKDGTAMLNTPVFFTLDGLEPNTLYYVRSFAINQAGVGYSETIQTFRTGSKPAVSTVTATNIGVTTANANFVVTNPGDPAAIEYGICYSSNSTLPSVENATTVKVVTPTVGSATPVSLTNLNQNTTYYYRAYAKLASGEIIYGEVESFKTQPDTLLQDLVASVSFTNGSKNDESGFNNHVIFVNNPTFVADRKGKTNSAVQLNGQGDYFYMNENNVLRPANLTVSIWIKPITVDRRMQIFNKGRFNDGAYEMYSSLIKPNEAGPGIVVNTDVKQNSNCQRGIGWQTFTFNSSFPLNTWHHIVMVYSGNTGRMYFDGALLSTTSNLPKTTIDDCIGGELKFGAQSLDFPNYFYGAIDDIRIYRKALTDSEVQALYNQ
ncbi:LamG-like jellyroll fold domain-containing protein [Larkinella sp. VNQ87]|uniref:LamG-like jellyroll fold domain-containing protein n=1 Tax=Larkinella sp. VNQ87 TaxID=3400921 RepID=UPI003BFE174B